MVSFTSPQEFFDFCISPSPTLLRTSLSKEASEIHDASWTFDFPVSVWDLNLFRAVGLLECLCYWRHPTSFCEGFWVFGLRFLGFVPGGS